MHFWDRNKMFSVKKDKLILYCTVWQTFAILKKILLLGSKVRESFVSATPDYFIYLLTIIQNCFCGYPRSEIFVFIRNFFFLVWFINCIFLPTFVSLSYIILYLNALNMHSSFLILILLHIINLLQCTTEFHTWMHWICMYLISFIFIFF